MASDVNTAFHNEKTDQLAALRAQRDADIDYDALGRLDELPDEDAAALIDQQMRLILPD